MKNKETKKLLIVGSIISLFVILIILMSFQSTNTSKEMVANFNTALNSNTNQMVYLGRPTCSYCQKLNPYIGNFVTNYNLKYTYVNTDLLSNGQLAIMLKQLGVDSKNFGTPYIAIVKGGAKIAEEIGYVEAKVLFNFLQKNSIIASEKTFTPIVATVDNLTQIDYAQYQTLLADKTPSIVVVGKTGCSYCTAAIPVLNQVMTEFGITINYLNLSNFTSESYTALGKQLATEVDKNWGTPTMVIVQNGEIIKFLIGFDSAKGKTQYVDFLRTNGLIK